MAQNVFNIPASAPFAKTLAEGVIARYGSSPLALAEVIIFLPTRRAVRTFSDAFAHAVGGSTLLPAFRALGDVGELDAQADFLGFSVQAPKPISRMRRRLLLAALVRRWAAARKHILSFPQAIAYADGLAAFLDDLQTQRADFEGLKGLVAGSMASHWEESRDFLLLLEHAWPQILADENAIDPGTHRNLALKALAGELAGSSGRPVIAAGSTGRNPATADLLATIAGMPHGNVVLPGLDRSLDEPAWSAVAGEPGHPQFGLNQLLKRLGVERDRVLDWENCSSNEQREMLLSQALRPAPTTDEWYRAARGPLEGFERGIDGLSVVEAVDEEEEAQAISLILRQALETPAQSVVLATPNRALARRVRAEMARFEIAVDDSAGQPLASTPAGRFLCLIADASATRFAPVPMLALLKHPLACANQERAEHLRSVRSLDLALRGPRPDPGLEGIARAAASRPALGDWFGAIAQILSPLERIMQGSEASLTDLIDAHVRVAERLSCGPKDRPAVWQREAGLAAFNLVASFREAAIGLSPIEPASYPSLFTLHARETAVRPFFGSHPSVAILGPLESRLQSFDVIVLGGLNEGGWPDNTASDPWLSRPMRRQMRLESPERGVGLAAHDFFMLACQRQVTLTRSSKEDGAPTIASRWLQRLQQLAHGLGLSHRLEPAIPWLDLAREVRKVSAPVARAPRPAPKPPVKLRPREMRVTEIETWRRDPYAVYARRILRLKKLDPLNGAVGPLERGTIVHKALERFIVESASGIDRNSVGKLIRIADDLFKEERIPRSTIAIWRPRFVHAATWFVEKELERRGLISSTYAEVEGTLKLPPDSSFTLLCRADRIDLMKTGATIIIDYKTGALPTEKQVEAKLAPQLPLEGAILAAGGFKGLPRLEPSELVYVRFSGGVEPGEWRPLALDATATSRSALAWLIDRIQRFDDPDTGYVSRAIPYREDIRGDYDHLARFGEWLETSAGWDA